MYCAKCGAFLADDARVCSSCGKPVRIRPAAGRPAGEKPDRAVRQYQGAGDRQDDFSRQIMDDEKIMDPAYFEDAAGNPDVESLIRLARGETVQAHEDRTPDADRTASITGEDTGRRPSNKPAARSSGNSGTVRETPADSRRRTDASSLAAEEKKEAEAARRRKEAAMKRRQASAARQRKTAASKRRKAVDTSRERPVYPDRSAGSAVRHNPKKSSMFAGIRRSMAEYTHAMEEAADERRMKKHMASAAKYYASLEMDDDWNEDPFRPYEETAEETAAAEFEPAAERTVKTAPVRAQTQVRAAEARETEKKSFTVSPVKEDDSEFSAKAGETADKEAPVSPVKAQTAMRAAEAEETVDKVSPARAESPERAETVEETVEKVSPARAESPEQTAGMEETVKRAVPADPQAAEYGMEEDAAADTAAAGRMFVSAAAVEELRARLTEELRPGLEEELRPGLEKELRAGLEEEIRPGLEKELRAGLEEEIRSRMETELRASLEKEYAARAGSGRTPGGVSLGEDSGQYEGLFSEEELRIEAARRLRKYYDAEQEEIDAAFGLFGLNRAMTVRLATFFLIVVLSVIYVAGRGNRPAAVQSGPSGSVSEDAASQDKDAGSKEEENMEDSVPTGGGEFGGGESSEEE